MRDLMCVAIVAALAFWLGYHLGSEFTLDRLKATPAAQERPFVSVDVGGGQLLRVDVEDVK